MIKLKSLLTEVIITTSEFDSVVKQAKKETGQNHKIPSKTKQMCKEVGKYKVNVYDYKGNKGKKRDVNGLMYQYYAYVQGWGHGKFKGPADWFLKGIKFDKILEWMYEHGHNHYFDYSYLRSHVSSDLQTAQIVSDIRKDDENTVVKKQDSWTFEKTISSKDPNWLLSST